MEEAKKKKDAVILASKSNLNKRKKKKIIKKVVNLPLIKKMRTNKSHVNKNQLSPKTSELVESAYIKLEKLEPLITSKSG